MGRERIIFPNHPEDLTWEGYKRKFPISASSIEIEKIDIKNNIDAIKLKLYGLVAATPKDITNDNDDPLEYLTNKFINLLNDYKFYIKKEHMLDLINMYQRIKTEDVDDDAGKGTPDPDVEKEWEPYVWFCNMCPDSEYECEREIKDAEDTAKYLINELMMYVTSTPTNVYEQKDEYSNDSFNEVHLRVREILDDSEGIEYYWWYALTWKFIMENYNEKSYNG